MCRLPPPDDLGAAARRMLAAEDRRRPHLMHDVGDGVGALPRGRGNAPLVGAFARREAHRRRYPTQAGRRTWGPRAWKLGSASFQRMAVAWIAMLLLCMMPSQWSPLPVESVRAMLGAAGRIGHAAGDVASASASVVTSVSTVFVGTVSGAMDFVGNFWHGIDLTDVMANVTSLSVLVDDGPGFAQMVEKASDGSLFFLEPLARAEVIEALGTVGFRMPLLRTHRHYGVLNSSAEVFLAEVRLNADGYIGVQWRRVVLAYKVRWASFAWDMMLMDPAAELVGVSTLAERVLSGLGASTFNASMAAADANTPRMLFSSVRLGARRVGLAVSWALR